MPELAWFAGVFEGEGCIRINRPTARNNGALILSVSNTDQDLLAPFQAQWPGFHKRVSVSGPNRKRAWTWVIASKDALAFLDAIEPYVVRRVVLARIELARAFQEGKVRTSEARTTAYRRRQLDFYWRMRALNARGTTPVVRPPDWDAVAAIRPEGWPSMANGRHHGNKLTPADRSAIAARRASGETCTALAGEFGVSTTRISQIGREVKS